MLSSNVLGTNGEGVGGGRGTPLPLWGHLGEIWGTK